MLTRLRGPLPVLCATLVLVGCERVPGPAAREEAGAIPLESLTTSDALPREWGRLVTVTTPDAPTTSLLWFEDDSGTVRMASFDHTARRIRPWIGVIPRTPGRSP